MRVPRGLFEEETKGGKTPLETQEVVEIDAS
jgi:hypothetical protein